MKVSGEILLQLCKRLKSSKIFPCANILVPVYSCTSTQNHHYQSDSKMPQIVSVRARVHVFHHKVSDLTIANVYFNLNITVQVNNHFKHRKIFSDQIS